MKKLIVALSAVVCLLLPAFSFAGDIFYPTGSYFSTETDLKVAARSIPMALERTYRSNRAVKIDDMKFDYRSPLDGPFGFGWNTPWTVKIVRDLFISKDGNTQTDAYVGADGRYIFFNRDKDYNYQTDYKNGYMLSRNPVGYELQQVGGITQVFDTTGRLTAIRDSRGKSATLSYSGNQLVSIADVTGRTVFTFNYTGSHVSRVTDLSGRVLEYAYDANGNLVSVTHGGAVITNYSYNSDHGITSQINALGEAWRTGYSLPSKGFTSKVTDPGGRNLTLLCDFANRIFTLTDFGGVTRRFILDGNGNVVSDSELSNGTVIPRATVLYQADGSKKTIDGAGNTTAEVLDAWQNVLSSTDGEGNTTTYTYNAQNKPLTVTDPVGVVTAFEYDASGVIPIKITRAKGKPEQTVTTFSYNGDGDLQSTSNGGATTGFDYNVMGLPTTVTDPLGNKSTLEYDAAGNVSASIDANLNRSEFGYDWRGNLLTTKDPLGNTTTYTYNAAGRLTTVKDPLTHTTTTSTDFAGRITSLLAPASVSKTFVYDGSGNLVKITEGDAVTNMTYDGRNRLLGESDPEGNTTYREYDNGGCSSCGASQSTPKKITDPLGNATQNSFDKVGRITGVTDPLGNLTSMMYDPAGRVTLRNDANGNPTSYAYDGLGRVSSQTDANGGVTSFSYDSRGNLTSLTDPEMNTTTFAYDLAGRKTAETRPEGEATAYDYYPNGLLKTVKDAKRQVTSYLYDKGNRLIETDFADGTKHTFGYDAAGNMTSYASPDVSATLTYDAANRKTGENVTMGGFTKSFSYSYDGKGNKSSFTTPEGTAYSYTYNRNSQPTQITTPVGNITLAYQWIRQTRVTLPNGIATDYAYNEANWLTQIKANKTGATPPTALTGATYTFDKVGNISGKTTEAGAHVYGYDALYQLTGATMPTLLQEAYSYDKVGNRKTSAQTQGGWSYNKDNELLSYNGTSHTYDANGNTVTKSESGATTTYNYGATDRLASVQLPDGSTAIYTYDPFGRRVRKQVGAETTYFLYADEGLVGEYDASGAFRKGYGWQPSGIWGTNPLFMVEDGKYSFYHNDHLGTPQKMTDIDGDVVWSATYGAFGNATIDPASTVTSNLRFPGQYFDEETGLHYNWQRYYDSKRGEYITKDLFENISENNHYAYVGNNPINLLDALGLYTTSQAGIDLIARHEGFMPRAYNDVAKNATIGYGYKLHAGPSNADDKKLCWTKQLALEHLAEKIKEKENAVNLLVKVTLTPNQFDALVSFTYNEGEGSLKKSTLLKYLNNGNYSAAASEFNNWVYANGGKKYDELVNRRKEEVDLFNSQQSTANTANSSPRNCGCRRWGIQMLQ
jgi:large repetitive protein